MGQNAENRGRNVKMDADQARRYKAAIMELREIRRTNFQNLSKRVEAAVLEFEGLEQRLDSLQRELVECQPLIKVLGGVRVLYKPSKGNRLTKFGPYFELSCHSGSTWLKRRRIRMDELGDIKLPEQTDRKVLVKLMASSQEVFQRYTEKGQTLETLEAQFDKAVSEVDGAYAEKVSLLKAESSSRLDWIKAIPALAVSLLDEIDQALDEQIHEFNEVTVRRYGAFVARWKIPPRELKINFVGPLGPEFSYISWEQDGKRMLSPVHQLAKKVDRLKKRPEREHKKNVITKEMIQNSRFGKHSTTILTAYRKVQRLATQRNALISWAQEISKSM